MDANAIMVLGLAAFLVRSGHVAHVVGSVRARSVADAAIRAVLGSACAILFLWLIGRLLAVVAASADTGTVEGAAVFFERPTTLLVALAAGLVPVAIVEGATAERARLVAGTLASTLVTAVAWTASVALGWRLFRDSESAQGLVAVWPVAAAHLVGGAAGIVAARTLGPRTAKYNRDGSANFIPPHNLTWIVAGDLLLILGLPILAGAAAGDALSRVADALLAASAAAVVAACVTGLRERRVDVILLLASAVCGAVAGGLSTPDLQLLAVALGAIVGAILPIAAIKLDLRFRVDDPTGLALLHLLGGVAGTFGAAVAEIRVTGETSWAHLPAALGVALGLIVLSVIAGGIVAFVAMLLGRAAGGSRVSDDAEFEGVDLALHDVNAYPDFQQTMIKSYHLRQ